MQSEIPQPLFFGLNCEDYGSELVKIRNPASRIIRIFQKMDSQQGNVLRLKRMLVYYNPIFAFTITASVRRGMEAEALTPASVHTL